MNSSKKLTRTMKCIKNIFSFFLITSLFVIHNNSFAQNKNYNNYYKHIINAQTFSSENQNEYAIKEYDQAFLNAYPFPDDIIDAIKLHQKEKNHVKINDLLKLLVKSGFKTENEIPAYIEEDNQFFKYLIPTHFPVSEYKNELDSIYKLHNKDYLKTIDISKDSYLSIFKSYEFFIVYTRKLANDDPDESKSIYLQEALWRSTKDLFLNLFHSKQDINRQETNSWNDDLFINCLIHSAQATTYKKDEYQKFLLEMVKEGNLHPYQYAIIIDDVERRSGKEQIYGTITDPIEFDGDIEKYRNTQKQISIIKNIETVDKRRKEIFLPPLWVSAQKYNLKLPLDYKR